jgi:putative transposase
VSKQAIHQMLERRMQSCEIEEYVIKLVYEIRKDHPTMSCRAMYFKLKPRHMGRDKFELLCHQFGLTIERKVNPFRTTDSSGVVRFDDLLKTAVLTSVNQAYSSDITYFEISRRFYYLTFILDCFSRRIIGFSVAKRLTTEHTTLPALQMAIRTRGNNLPKGIIFHSDGGGQYYDKEFLKLTSKYQMRNSMCEMAYENGKAERINGVIKNNYLRFYEINNEKQLLKSVDRAVYLYNAEKPHKGLKYATPLEFEKHHILLPQQTEPKMTESLEAKSDFWGIEPQKIWQTEPQNQDVL